MGTGRLWVVVLGIGLVSNAGADTGDPPTRAIEHRDPGDVEKLQDLLAKRETELASMRDRLRVLEDEERWYSEADELGIPEVLRHSALTERAQRRVAIAIVREAEANGLDPLLVVAVIRTESAFNAYAVSGVGAMGLMQMMPTTGSLLATQRGTTLRHRQTLFDAELNVELGTAYLAALLREFGTVEAALLAYNGGPAFARRVLRNADARRRFGAGYPHDVKAEWRKLWVRYAEIETRRSVPEAGPTLAAEGAVSTAQ
jgi:soluble lytic murein transglycosylase